MNNEKTFRQQFMELLTGSTLAQVFSLILMPVISRLYGPSDLGEYAIYVAISSIAGLLVNFRLDLAVVLADDEREGAHLVYAGMIASVVGALMILLGNWLYGFSWIFNWMTALSVGAMGGFQCLVGWHSRQRHYKTLASRSAGEKLLVLLCGLTLGWWGFTQYGLIVAQTLGLIFSFIYLFLVSGLPPWHHEIAHWFTTLRKFSDFPRTNALSSSLMVAALFLPSLLFAGFFPKAELGHYNLAGRLFEVPINLIGYTFSTVYYQHSSRLQAGERLRLFWKSLRWLSALFVPGLVLVALLGPWLMATVFGEVWRPAGVLAQWLAIVTVFRLLYVSQSTLLLVQRRLHLDLVVSTMLFAAQVGGFFLGLWQQNTVVGCVMTMSLLASLVYAYGLILIRQSLTQVTPQVV